MKHFSKAWVAIALVVIFMIAGLTGGSHNRFDLGVIEWTTAMRAQMPAITGPLVFLTHLGSAYATLGLGFAIAAWLWWRGAGRHALLLAGTVVVERLVMDGLKLLVDRARPALDMHPVATHSASFPSGHAANTMAVFVAIALIAAPAIHRRAAVLAAAALSIVIGLTRPLLGVHWPTDVVGGWALGLISVWIALWIALRADILAIEAKHDVVGGHGTAVDQNQPIPPRDTGELIDRP